MPYLPAHLTGLRHSQMLSQSCPEGPAGLAEALHTSCHGTAHLEGLFLLNT